MQETYIGTEPKPEERVEQTRERTANDVRDRYLDSYDLILTHTFPASDAIQNW